MKEKYLDRNRYFLMRTIVIFVIILCAFIYLILHLATVTQNDTLNNGVKLSEVAKNQSRYQLTIAKGRGTIYDTNLTPLTNSESTFRAVALPCENSLKEIKELVDEDKFANIVNRMSNGNAILIDIDKMPEKKIEKFYPFEIKKSNSIAEHILGYTNSENVGVTAIQKDFDSYLSMNNNEFSLTYSIDALGRVLGGDCVDIVDEISKNKKGVVTTIDKHTQEVVESVGKDKLKKGAIVLMDCENGEIRAMASFPTFDSNAPQNSLGQSDAPMMNRVLSAYNVGSLFKLVGAVSSLENNINLDYLCTGTTQVGKYTFQCINKTKHGEVNLEKALSQSCNCYFIHLAQRLGAERLYKTTVDCGFGEKIELSQSIVSSAGQLPKLEDLEKYPTQLANFSFGQGELLATPLQVCSLISTIENEGVENKPTLIKGKVDEIGNFIKEKSDCEKRIMSSNTANEIKKYMMTAVKSGSAYTANCEGVTMGAKTATAETGIYINDKQVIQAWCGGFFEVGEKKYSLVVLAENGVTGSSTAGPIFKEVVSLLQ